MLIGEAFARFHLARPEIEAFSPDAKAWRTIGPNDEIDHAIERSGEIPQSEPDRHGQQQSPATFHCAESFFPLSLPGTVADV